MGIRFGSSCRGQPLPIDRAQTVAYLHRTQKNEESYEGDATRLHITPARRAQA